MAEPVESQGHAFICYAREDSDRVDHLERMLRAAGVPTWRDVDNIWPGDDWKHEIRKAIAKDTLVFIACFSAAGLERRSRFQNEELTLAVEELRRRRPGEPWFIPVRFDECAIPDMVIGPGRTIADLHHADLFGPDADRVVRRVVESVRRILGRPQDAGEPLEAIYQADQILVADSITALREGARRMLGARAAELDIFGPEAAEALGDRGWDVLQNYAELAFPTDHPYSRDLIDASYDPAWRQALRLWAQQNPALLTGEQAQRLPAFDHAAAIDLDRYMREFDDPVPELEAAVAAGRLPCPASLGVRSPELARLAMRVWRVTSPDSPLRHQLLDEGAPAQPDGGVVPGSESTALRGGSDTLPAGPLPAFAPADDHRPKSTLDVINRLFEVAPEDGGRSRTQRRKKSSGSHQRTDLTIRAKAVSADTWCFVQWRSGTAPVSVSSVATQLLAAEASCSHAPIEHWILISPQADPDDTLARLIEGWNKQRRYPFTVQIWSPATGVRDLIGLEPPVYRSIYRTDPPRPLPDPSAVVDGFSRRLQTPARLPERLAAYLEDRRSFVEGKKELAWLDELSGQIERFGSDEKGARLARPLQAEVLSALSESPADPGVVLVLTEFGEGKSFFTVSLCVNLRDRYLADPQAATPIPVRLLLRAYRLTDSPIEFLRAQLEQRGLSMDAWHDLVRRDVNVLVILDGLDEMSVRQDAATTRANLDKLGDLLELLEGLPVLVTSRPHFFASAPDRERFYDRLRRPRVFRMSQPDRREIVANLRAFASTPVLAAKLDKIKELYDPIGLAGKVLFLEMIKATLANLPEDRFDELILYETYVDQSLRRKIHLLRDPSSELDDSELMGKLEELLEKIAVAIHNSGEGSVDLRQFAAEAGGAAQLLWRASESDETGIGVEADAAARIAGRSLLRRVPSPEQCDDQGWVVDFFHRSMKEYFVAKAFKRALQEPDPLTATRELLLRTPVQPEILGFFKLFAKDIAGAPAALTNLAHFARIGSGQGPLGGGAISLLYAASDQVSETDWRSLDLEGALLAGASLARTDFRSSILRGADLSHADFTGADMRNVDMTGANLSAGGGVVAFCRDNAPDRYLCLTLESMIGRIAIKANGSLAFSFIPLPRLVRSPRGIFLLAEDALLIAGQSEFVVVEIGTGRAEEAAYFRISPDIRAVSLLDQFKLGMLCEPEHRPCEALLLDLDGGATCWRIPVSPHGQVCGWSADGVLIGYDKELIFYRHNSDVIRIKVDFEPSGYSSCVADGTAITMTDDGHVAWVELVAAAIPELLTVHNGAGTAVVAAGQDVLTAGSDGSIALIRRDDADQPVETARLDWRLRCAGAKVGGLQREREREIFLANGARPANATGKPERASRRR